MVPGGRCTAGWIPSIADASCPCAACTPGPAIRRWAVVCRSARWSPSDWGCPPGSATRRLHPRSAESNIMPWTRPLWFLCCPAATSCADHGDRRGGWRRYCGRGRRRRRHESRCFGAVGAAKRSLRSPCAPAQEGSGPDIRDPSSWPLTSGLGRDPNDVGVPGRLDRRKDTAVAESSDENALTAHTGKHVTRSSARLA